MEASGTTTQSTKATSTVVALCEIRCTDNALCLIDLHAFLRKYSGIKHATCSLKKLVACKSHPCPNTFQVIQDDGVVFASTRDIRLYQTRTLEAIRTPDCLVAVIREHLQHYKNISQDSVRGGSVYPLVIEQAHVFANAFSQTFPHLWCKSGVCGLLETTLEDFPKIMDLQRMKKDISEKTGRRCRISDPEKLLQLHCKIGMCVSCR